MTVTIYYRVHQIVGFAGLYPYIEKNSNFVEPLKPSQKKVLEDILVNPGYFKCHREEPSRRGCSVAVCIMYPRGSKVSFNSTKVDKRLLKPN